MRKIFLRVIAMAAAVYIGLCVCLFIFQRSLIYYPQPRANTTGITVLTLENGAERALVSSRPHDGDDAVLYFGGNAEDVSLDMPEYAAAFPDAAIYLLHYRGYGGSTGDPSEKGIVADALACLILSMPSTKMSWSLAGAWALESRCRLRARGLSFGLYW
jgi:uncharacterized protein